MSVVMGAFLLIGSGRVRALGADRVVVTVMPVTVTLSIAFAVWAWQSDGVPTFLAWFGIPSLLNALRTLINPLLMAQAMQPMGELAGTASAVIGTISMGGGAVLASFVDRAIDGTVTPLAVAYAGYGTIGTAFAFWARSGSKT